MDKVFLYLIIDEIIGEVKKIEENITIMNTIK